MHKKILVKMLEMERKLEEAMTKGFLNILGNSLEDTMRHSETFYKPAVDGLFFAYKMLFGHKHEGSVEVVEGGVDLEGRLLGDFRDARSTRTSCSN